MVKTYDEMHGLVCFLDDSSDVNTASKAKHRLNIFIETAVQLSYLLYINVNSAHLKVNAQAL